MPRAPAPARTTRSTRSPFSRPAGAAIAARPAPKAAGSDTAHRTARPDSGRYSRHDLQPVIAGLDPRGQRGAQRPIIHRLVHMDEDGTFGRELRDPFERGRKIGMRRMRAHAQTIENPDVQILIQGTHIIAQDIEIGSISDTQTISREPQPCPLDRAVERKSTRLNSS